MDFILAAKLWIVSQYWCCFYTGISTCVQFEQFLPFGSCRYKAAICWHFPEGFSGKFFKVEISVIIVRYTWNVNMLLPYMSETCVPKMAFVHQGFHFFSGTEVFSSGNSSSGKNGLKNGHLCPKKKPMDFRAIFFKTKSAWNFNMLLPYMPEARVPKNGFPPSRFSYFFWNISCFSPGTLPMAEMGLKWP